VAVVSEVAGFTEFLPISACRAASRPTSTDWRLPHHKHCRAVASSYQIHATQTCPKAFHSCIPKMIAQNSTSCDGAAIEQLQGAVRTLLQGVGEDVEREGLMETPKRVAKALLYMTSGYHDDPEGILCKAIFNEEGVAAESNGIVVVRDIDFASTCEETLLPFHGRVHIGYIPSHGRVLGLSKMSRLTSIFARRLQTQARMSTEILDTLMTYLKPQGAAIVVEARHLAHPESSGLIVTSDAVGSFRGPESSAWLVRCRPLNRQQAQLPDTHAL